MAYWIQYATLQAFHAPQALAPPTTSQESYMKFRHPEGWTVGHFCNGKWTPLTDHSDEHEADQVLALLGNRVSTGRYSAEDTPVVLVPLSVVDLYALMALMQRSLALNVSCTNCSASKIRWLLAHLRHHLLQHAQPLISQWLANKVRP